MPIRALKLAAAALRVLAEHAHVSAVPPPVALEDLDRGRLAGAVGAEEREDLAGLDGEGEPVQDLALPVGLAEARDGDCAHGGRGYRRFALVLPRGRPAHPLGAARPRLAVARVVEALLDGRREEAEAQLAVRASRPASPGEDVEPLPAPAAGADADATPRRQKWLVRALVLRERRDDGRARRLPRPSGDGRARARQGGARLHGLPAVPRPRLRDRGGRRAHGLGREPRASGSSSPPSGRGTSRRSRSCASSASSRRASNGTRRTASSSSSSSTARPEPSGL